MPVPPGARLDPEATRERILHVSEEIFATRGTAAVSVSDLAAAAGASKASMYKNFRSKELLIEATLADRSARVQEWLRHGVESLPPGRRRILRIFDLLLDWYRQDDFHGCAVVSAAAETRMSDEALRAIARRHLDSYRALMARSLQGAGANDADALVEHLLILIEGATVVSAVDGEPEAGVRAREIAGLLLQAAGVAG
ncbi:TetR/AcrR family transcriptional regulator [Frondihabitans cladoniiphilus]|uniref:TetR/AcrR family transcriptional regulator n=1 Tax=Frondihabitans cladoniiphilus TaxID=715785 RepID=A0ABP8WCA0_9MICO